MSFLYSRVVAISRAAVAAEFGQSPYSGESPGSETVIASGLSASIQMKATGNRPDAGLPADASKKTYWRILIPLSQLAPGIVKTRDIITDDLGERYTVTSNYFSSLGANFLAEKLEV